MCGQPVIQLKAGAVKSARERIIKLLVDVRVDATHQSLFTHFKWATLYVGVDIFFLVCSHLLQSLKRLIFGNRGSTTHACMP